MGAMHKQYREAIVARINAEETEIDLAPARDADLLFNEIHLLASKPVRQACADVMHWHGVLESIFNRRDTGTEPLEAELTFAAAVTAFTKAAKRDLGLQDDVTDRSL